MCRLCLRLLATYLPMILYSLLDLGEQLTWFTFEGTRKLQYIQKCNIALPSLDATKVATSKPALKGQPLL